MNIKLVLSALLMMMLAGCASNVAFQRGGPSIEATPASFAKTGQEKGLVLLGVNWSRYWGCARHQNAQLLSFTFRHMPQQGTDNHEPDMILETPNRLFTGRGFMDYALLVPPGEYALSHFMVKIADSVSEIFRFAVGPDELIPDGKPYGGSFHVSAGETVYIGHFGLNCATKPILWRYYIRKKQFDHDMAFYKTKYPFINPDNVMYRLFETDIIGRPPE